MSGLSKGYTGLGLPFPLNSEKIALCYNIEGKSTLGAGFSSLLPSIERSSVCFNIDGHSIGGTGGGGGLSAISPELASVCVDIKGSSTTSIGTPITGSSALKESAFACFNLDGNSTSYSTLPLDPDTLNASNSSILCFDIEGLARTSTLIPLAISWKESANMCFELDGISRTIVSTPILYDEDSSSFCFEVEGEMTNSLFTPIPDIKESSSLCFEMSGESYIAGSRPPIGIGSSLIFYAPIGQTGVGTSSTNSDYVTLTPSSLLYFKIWDTVTSGYINVPFSYFIQRRLLASDRVIEYDRHLCSLPLIELDLDFPQAVGQTATTIGVFYAHPVGAPIALNSINQLTGDLYSITPVGGATSTTLPSQPLNYLGKNYVIYRLTAQIPNTSLTLRTVCY
jgi:hypothetical protein